MSRHSCVRQPWTVVYANLGQTDRQQYIYQVFFLANSFIFGTVSTTVIPLHRGCTTERKPASAPFGWHAKALP